MNGYILHPYMNSHAVDFHEKFHQNHGLVSDYSSGFGCSSPVYMLHEPMISMSTYAQQEIIEEGLKQQIYIPEKPSGTTIHQFKSPASAFYAKERCMGIPQIGFRSENSSHVLGRLCNSQILPNQASAENGSIDLDEADDPNFQMRNTLQSLVKSQICVDQPQRSSIEEPFELSSRNFHGSKFLFRDKLKRFFDLNTRNNEINSISFSHQSMKQPPNLLSGMTSSSSSSSLSSFIDSSRKSRIRWTQDLHEKFVECVKYLGGADKATPKAILKLMDSEGLTVLHVKSHLQKYRNAKYTPESAEERSKRRCISSAEPQFDAKTGLQIKESLQLQLDVQRRLHEQLEIQKKLQLQIEAQGRKLKMMFDEQQKTRQVLNTFPPDNPSNAIDDGAQAYTSESSEISQLQFNTSSSLNPENNFSLLNHC